MLSFSVSLNFSVFSSVYHVQSLNLMTSVRTCFQVIHYWFCKDVKKKTFSNYLTLTSTSICIKNKYQELPVVRLLRHKINQTIFRGSLLHLLKFKSLKIQKGLNSIARSSYPCLSDFASHFNMFGFKCFFC